MVGKLSNSIAAWIAAAMVFTASAIHAAEYHTLVAGDGTEIVYAVVLREGFDPSQSHPVMVALPPGGQDRAMVEAGLGFWQVEGPRRGYVVVSPAAPGGRLFFNEGAGYLSEFLDRLGDLYQVAGGKFHLTGISNGGLSAFRAAIDRPSLFHSLTVLPGFPPDQADMARLGRLVGIHVTMLVGARDTRWIDRMEATARELARLGADVQYVIVPEAGHVIRSLAGAGSARLFNLIEK